jgi:hypothetical protein
MPHILFYAGTRDHPIAESKPLAGGRRPDMTMPYCSMDRLWCFRLEAHQYQRMLVISPVVEVPANFALIEAEEPRGSPGVMPSPPRCSKRSAARSRACPRPRE